MLDTTDKSKKFGKYLWNFTKGFTLLLTYEVIEELLEESIAWAITTVMARAISFIVVVLLTQTTKVTIKGLAKGITILLKPLVKKITYRVGNDKIDKIRRIYKAMKNVILKFFAFVARNKKTITSTLVALVGSLGAGGFTGGGMLFGGVQLPMYAYYLIGAGVALVLFALTEMGVIGKGLENKKEYEDRLAKEDAEKATKAEEKALLKAYKKEQKEADAKAKEEEAKKLQEEEAKKAELAELQRAQEEKRKEEEIGLKLQQLTREFEDAKAQGFEGSFRDFISNRK